MALWWSAWNQGRTDAEPNRQYHRTCRYNDNVEEVRDFSSHARRVIATNRLLLQHVLRVGAWGPGGLTSRRLDSREVPSGSM